jgi:hypothetical protein
VTCRPRRVGAGCRPVNKLNHGNVQHGRTEKQAAGQPRQVGESGQQRQGDDQAQHARRHQYLVRVEPHDAQGIQFLVEFHYAQRGGKSAARTPSHHDGRHDNAHFPQDGNGDQVGDKHVGAELGQLRRPLVRDDHAHEKTDQADDGNRLHTGLIDLPYRFAEGKRRRPGDALQDCRCDETDILQSRRSGSAQRLQSAPNVLLLDDRDILGVGGHPGIDGLGQANRKGHSVIGAVAHADVIDFHRDVHFRVARKIQCYTGDQPELGADDLEERRVSSGQSQFVGAQRVVGNQDIGNFDAARCVRIFPDACNRIAKADGRRLVYIGDRDRQRRGIVRRCANSNIVDFDRNVQDRLCFEIQAGAGHQAKLGADDLEQVRVGTAQAQLVLTSPVVGDDDIGDLDGS